MKVISETLNIYNFKKISVFVLAPETSHDIILYKKDLPFDTSSQYQSEDDRG